MLTRSGHLGWLPPLPQGVKVSGGARLINGILNIDI